MTNQQFTGTKYAGARWLQDRKSNRTLMPLAVRIANVLGQVFDGIYHLTDENTRSMDSLYKTASEYTVNIGGSIATHDGDKLTRLLLCCQASGLDLLIAGNSKGYMKLTFKIAQPTAPSIEELCTVTDFDSFADLESPKWRDYIGQGGYFGSGESKFVSSGAAFLSMRWMPDGSVCSFEIRSSEIDMARLQEIVSRAHSACCRIEVEGRCPRGLGQIGLHLSKRSRTATTTMEGHPNPSQAVENLRPFWDIDYMRLD